MRRNKEIIVLLGLLVGMMVFVLGYVIHRRTKLRATPPTPSTQAAGPLAPTTKNAPVDLTKHDGQTIDFSSGQPVVKNSTEDQAALAAAKREIDAAVNEVTFKAPKNQ